VARCRSCTEFKVARRKSVSDFRAIADRVEIEAPCGEFTDAVTMRGFEAR